MPITIDELTLTPVQTGRPFRVTTALGPDALLLERFTGEERVSQPFRFLLDVVAADPALDPGQLLGQPASLAMRLTGGAERTLHGRVRRLAQLATHDGAAAFRLEVVPWLWFLSLTRDCRIFQRKTVPEIVEQVFGECPIAAFESRLVGEYPRREYTVQYRETHLDFVSRLLEEEGIFYFFRHEESRHVLVLADSPSGVKPCPGQETARVAAAGREGEDENVVTSLALESAVHTGDEATRSAAIPAVTRPTPRMNPAW